RVDADLVKTMQPAGKAYYVVLACLAAVVAWGAYAWSVQLRRGLGRLRQSACEVVTVVHSAV
ncbi:MAG: hypothetical protein AAB654_20065, partial [Acidobacteriota bacterium]